MAKLGLAIHEFSISEHRVVGDGLVDAKAALWHDVSNERA
jgi:hypothetical protein